MAALPSELLSLLHPCKEEPDDDTPRLVLADWLEENGETARGQLMRLQVRAARMSLRECVEQRTASRTHEVLLCRHHLAPLQEAGIEAEFQRGLLAVRAPLALARASAKRRAAALGAWPWVESVEITGTRRWGVAGLSDWCVAGLLGGVPEWRLVGIHLDPSVAGFFDGPGVPIPKSLSALPWHIPADALVRLGASRLAAGLRSLTLEHARIRRPHCRALAAGAWHLPEFALDGNRIGDVGAVELSSAGWMAGLTAFRAAGASIGPRGLRALLKAGSLRGVRRLDLSGNRLGPEGARAIASSDALPGLRELNLSENGLEDGGARALVESPRLNHLTRLALRGNGITGDVRAGLEDRFGERVSL